MSQNAQFAILPQATAAPPAEVLPRPSRAPLGLLLGGAGAVLVLAIVLLAYMANQRSEAGMARLLGEKGSSLIVALEGGLRSGMRSGAGVLLEEIASGPDIIFVALAMPDGTIVAHSDRERLGEIVRFNGAELDETHMAGLAPDSHAR